MTPPLEPREAEAVAVTLTRMEGTLNGVAEKVTELRTQVNQQGVEIGELKAKTQQLASDQRTAEATRVATERATRAADDAREAASRAAAQRWTPVQRLLAALASLAAIITTLYYIAHPS